MTIGDVLRTAALSVVLAGTATAETLPSALARAYMNNPDLNAGRASLRAIDENVPRALSGYRPSVAATASAGATYETGRTGSSGVLANTRDALFPRQAALQVTQNLFNGFRTANSVREAESGVLGARETLRQTEGDTLFSAAQAYMDVLRDTATLDLHRNNVEVLEEQLRQTRERYTAGEVTRTDIAQAEARLEASRSQVSLAQANLQSSIATFRRIIGVEPRQLAAGKPPDQLIPSSLAQAVRIALAEHPAILSALHAVDAAELQVKVVEGELAPSLNLVGSVGGGYDTSVPGDRSVTAAFGAQLTVPLYEGGETYARVRQAKEVAGQRRIEAEATRDAVRSALFSAWGALESAKANVISAQAQVAASEVALTGVREEARAGQRTTLDVLNQQQELLIARVNLIVAQRDRVVGAFSVAQAVGRLNAASLALRVPTYRPGAHYEAVRDLPWGLTTPDGR
ncbi:TolC family outer membrane protein [Enterovirga aerilata]|uniref:TolC family outer membrane protein n=1 Tax=Enterovirga aerilata TaxID=2730920 RepID=A0A849IA08_9HYPH|nr:TolC family outer membrane protein [Enterovirga sp. DB1703]NNM74228.1 TolC family outer membrane protein [Enterovirga sp. DB1703]